MGDPIGKTADTAQGVGSLSSGKNAADDQGAAAAKAKQVAMHLFGQTEPLRVGVVQTLTDLIGGKPLGQIQGYAPSREALESQFNVANQNIMNSVPNRGGLLSSELAQSQLARAQSVGMLDAQLRQQAFGQASNIGFQTPALTLGGLSSAGNIFGNQAGLYYGNYNNAANRTEQTNLAAKNNMSSAAGGMMGGK